MNLEGNEHEQESLPRQVSFEPSIPAWGYRKRLEKLGKLPKKKMPAVESATATSVPPLEDSDREPDPERRRLTTEMEAKIRADISHMTLAQMMEKYGAYR